MSAITSAGTGVWSTGGTWNGGVSPGAGDTCIIQNGHTVTLDQAATLSIGADSATAAIAISSGGKLQYLSTATNSLTIDAKGDITVTGTLEFGTNANPIPSTRTCTIKLNDSSALADGKYGFKTVSGGVVNLYGASKTLQTTLTADVAANATTFVVADVTGWAASDAIALGSTTRTPGDAESVTVSSIATLTVTILAGGGTGANSMKNAHGGGGSSQNGTAITARVVNQTCNVKVTSANTADAGFITIVSGSTFTAKYVEFSYLGVNATNQHGVEFGGTGSSVTFCSVHDTRNYGVYFATTTGSNTFSNNVCYNLNTQAAAASSGVSAVATSGAHTVDTNWIIGITVPANGTCIGWFDAGSTLTNNYLSSGAIGGSATTLGLSISETAGVLGTITGNVVQSCAGHGFSPGGAAMMGTLGSSGSPNLAWRNGGAGLVLSGVSGKLTVFQNGFGNTTQNVLVSGAQFNTLLKSCTFNSDSSFSTTSGINFTASSKLYLEDCSLGATTAHTQDVIVAAQVAAEVLAINCLLSSGTDITLSANVLQATTVRQQRAGQAATYKSKHGMGLVQAQQTTRHTASGYAYQATPLSATIPLIIPGPTVWDSFKVPVLANTQVTISCWVYYDGTYNGATMPTLTLVGGILQGIASDVTAVAASASSVTWLQLSVAATPTENGTVECYVSGVGTAGNFYVDDFLTSQP